MQYIDFKVQHQTITRTDKYQVVGGSENYLRARFDFCEEWADITPTAVFSTNSGKHIGVAIENGECLVPWEVLRSSEFWVGVFGGERLTTSTARVAVKPGVKFNASPGVEPTPTAYEKLVGIVADSAKVAESAKNAAAESAEDAERYAAASQESAEEASDRAAELKSYLDGVQNALDNLPEGSTVVVNDLKTGGTKAALSAEMGKTLGQKLDEHEETLPRNYQERVVGWHVSLVRGETDHMIASASMSISNIAVQGVQTETNPIPYSELVYHGVPFPVNSLVETAVCDRGGQYVSAVNHVSGDAILGISYRIYAPTARGETVSSTVRWNLMGCVKKPVEKPQKAFNKDVADEMVAIAQSYVDAQLAGRKFSYGSNFLNDSSSAINNAAGEGVMECDTYVGLIIRGITYEDSPYTNLEPGFQRTYEDVMANCNHSTSEWCSTIRGLITNDILRALHRGKDVKYASDMACMSWYVKGSVFSDASYAQPGDLCFWRKPDQMNFFDNIGHVALMGEDGYIYEVSSKGNTNGRVLHKVKLSEKSTQPDYFARLY